MRSSPGRIEGRLDAGHDTEVGQQGKVLDRGHLQVLEAMACGAHGLDAHIGRRGAQSVGHDQCRPVTDDVEARLLARAGGCGHVGRHLLCGQVCRSATGR